jgi:hypothetical protein
MADTATVDRLDAGDHACLTFSDPEERLDLVAAFVRAGLRRGQKVVCWTDSVSPEDLVGEIGAPGGGAATGSVGYHPGRPGSAGPGSG